MYAMGEAPEATRGPMIDKLLRIAFALRAQRRVAVTIGVCGLVLLAASPAQAGLKIRPVFRGGLPPPTDCTDLPPTDCKMVGGGDLEEIFKVAVEAWEAVFKGGSGNWDVTIEFVWHNIGAGAWGRVARGTATFGGNNPVRITGGLLESTTLRLIQAFSLIRRPATVLSTRSTRRTCWTKFL
jgi:hypothetical protein